MEMIQKDNICATLHLESVKKEGKANFTIKCPDAETAKKLEETMKDKYGNKVEVKGVNPATPKVKIIRVPTGITDKDQIKKQLVNRNQWLRDARFNIAEIYTIEVVKHPYTNIIVETDLLTQRLMLKKGVVIFGFQECRIFEHINVLQCNRCSRYGHFARECFLPANCKKCSESHETKDCVVNEVINKCHNCILANKRGESYNIRHCVTDDRCPVRMERVLALKICFAGKN